MKVLIPAGGKETGLKPVTCTIVEQPQDVANKPFLFCVVDQTRRTGLTNVGMSFLQVSAYLSKKVPVTAHISGTGSIPLNAVSLRPYHARREARRNLQHNGRIADGPTQALPGRY